MSLSITDFRDTADEQTKRQVLESFPDPRRNTLQYTDDDRRHTDAQSIRRFYGFGKFDPDVFEREHLVPNVLLKHWHPPTGHIKGGKDFLARGKPGSGKSTLANHIAAIGVEQGTTVVWRGSPSRSEWLPLAPWARVCLPRAARSIEIMLEPEDKSREVVELGLDELEQMVREVVYYDNPLDLNHNVLTAPPGDRSKPLGDSHGTFNVVYPDPMMTRCQEIYEESDVKEEGIEFTPESPLNHWWFGWFMARIDYGPHSFMDWIADEFGEVAPTDVEKDEFGSYQLVNILRDKWVDARKNGLSAYMFVHDEAECNPKIVKKVRWRVQMPLTGNPTSKGAVLGFENVPMETDMMSRYKNPGTALMYDESSFEKFDWADLSVDFDYKLKIRVS